MFNSIPHAEVFIRNYIFSNPWSPVMHGLALTCFKQFDKMDIVHDTRRMENKDLVIRANTR